MAGYASLTRPTDWRESRSARTSSLFENFLLSSLLDDSGRQGRNVAQAAPGVEDVAAIAERPGGIGDEAPGVDNIAPPAHRVHLQGIGDPVAPHPFGGAVVIGGHHRIGMRAVEEGGGAGGREALLMDRPDAAGQR